MSHHRKRIRIPTANLAVLPSASELGSVQRLPNWLIDVDEEFVALQYSFRRVKTHPKCNVEPASALQCRVFVRTGRFPSRRRSSASCADIIDLLILVRANDLAISCGSHRRL